MHHVDVHVRDLEAAGRLFDALGDTLRYRRRPIEEPDFIGYEPVDGGRPRIGFLKDASAGGTTRIAFGVHNAKLVDQAAAIASQHGAEGLEGPSLHPEYGDDYYAVFFQDADGNKFEVVVDATVSKPRIARIWRGRVRPGKIAAYRRYISGTGIVDYRATPGNCGAWILSAHKETHDDVITLSFWESRDAIVRFAGEPIERSQYYPEDEKYLLDFPKEVEHFDID
jgi:predicted lactoylglutathione lyase/heme-degrading monooxygenase HmoA